MLAAADEVGARVADVAERDVPPSVDERDRHRRAHPGGAADPRSSARRRAGSPPGSGRRSRSSPPLVARPLSSSAAAASRDATSPACAPPIPSAIAKSGGSQTYESSLRRRLRPVSVMHADRAERAHCSYLRSVSPTRTTSPWLQPARLVEPRPVENVPFVEPRSCTQTPSCRGSKRAWRAEANSSPSSGDVVLAAAADRHGAESSSKSLALSSAGLLTTTSRPRARSGCAARMPRPRPGRARGSKLSCGECGGRGSRCARSAR